MAVSCTEAHLPQEIMLTGIRWAVAYPLSPPHGEALMLARGGHVDHATMNRWIIKDSPQFLTACNHLQPPINGAQWLGTLSEVTVTGLLAPSRTIPMRQAQRDCLEPPRALQSLADFIHQQP